MSVLAIGTDQLSLSFVRGLVASVNPCGFVLLPTYLLYFLGLQANDGAQRASMRRALAVGSAVSAGFMSVFVVVGTVSYNFTNWIEQNAKYATAVIALGLIALGASMLFGYRLPISTPNLTAGGRGRTFGSMFVYGIAYAVASISCTIGLFFATVFGATRNGGLIDGAANATAYGAGMALVVVSLTVSLAAAKTGLLGFLRSKMQYIEMVAASLVILSGIYLLVYFWVVDINLGTNPVTARVEDFQTWATARLSDNWQMTGVVLAVIVAIAIAIAAGRRESGGGSSPEGPDWAEDPPPADTDTPSPSASPSASTQVPSGTVAGDA